MIGAPNSAVTALIGSVPCVHGSCEIRSHISNVVAPHKMDAGKIIL